MAIGIELLRFCDELRVYGDTISEGMAAELDEAQRFNIPIRYETDADLFPGRYKQDGDI
jgi:hypothetical protein